MIFKVTFDFWPVQHPIFKDGDRKFHAARPRKIFIEADTSSQAIELAKQEYPQSWFRDFKAIKTQWKPKDKDTVLVACDMCEFKGLEPTRKNIEQEYSRLKNGSI